MSAARQPASPPLAPLLPPRPPALLWRALYAVLLAVGIVGLRLVALRNAKVRETLAGRDGLWERLGAALARRDPARPLLWFHVASAGELQQAQPVLERMLGESAQGVLTVTSVSGFRWAQARRAELPGLLAVDYLPLDTRRNVRRLLALLRPAALIYTRYDLWPHLVWEAAAARVPQVLLAAALHERSWRERSAMARAFYRTLYAPLAQIHAVSEADAVRFLRTVPEHAGVSVLGDPRVDAVLRRREGSRPPPLLPYEGPPPGPVLVVGSSWPADERHLLPALTEALTGALVRHPALRVLFAPHEMLPAHLDALERAFAPYGCARFTALAALAAGAAPWRVLLVDTVGRLAALYAYADLAYVGGGFGGGVHNVLEPAAMGAAPIFGPRYRNAPEAIALHAEGLAFAVEDAESMRQVLGALLDDPTRRGELGRKARDWVQAQAGAAERSCARIRTLPGLERLQPGTHREAT